MKKFAFNKFGVCTNPIEYKVHKGKSTVYIMLAQHNKRWVYGYRLNSTRTSTGSGGCSVPCYRNKPGRIFTDKADCLKFAINEVADRMAEKNYPERASVQKLFNELHRAMCEAEFRALNAPAQAAPTPEPVIKQYGVIKSYRLPVDTVRAIDRLSKATHTGSASAVVAHAVGLYYSQVFRNQIKIGL